MTGTSNNKAVAIKASRGRSPYFTLAVQASLFFITPYYLATALHEIGHGITAQIVGLDFIGMYVSPFGTSYAFIEGLKSGWRSVAIHFGGPAVELLVGLISYFIVLPRMREWAARLFWFYLAVTSLLAFWIYMALGGFFGHGDFRNIADSLGIARPLLGFTGLAGGVVFIYMFTRRALKSASRFLSLDTFGSRLAAATVLLLIPAAVFMAICTPFSSTRILAARAAAVPVFLAIMAAGLREKNAHCRAYPSCAARSPRVWRGWRYRCHRRMAQLLRRIACKPKGSALGAADRTTRLREQCHHLPQAKFRRAHRFPHAAVCVGAVLEKDNG